MGLSQHCSLLMRLPFWMVFNRLMLFGHTAGNLLASICPAIMRGHVIFVFGSGGA